MLFLTFHHFFSLLLGLSIQWNISWECDWLQVTENFINSGVNKLGICFSSVTRNSGVSSQCLSIFWLCVLSVVLFLGLQDCWGIWGKGVRFPGRKKGGMVRDKEKLLWGFVFSFGVVWYAQDIHLHVPGRVGSHCHSLHMLLKVGLRILVFHFLVFVAEEGKEEGNWKRGLG